MIELRFSASDMSNVSFAYSPLAEAAASLHMLAGGGGRPVHRRWLAMVREPLDRVDLDLLTSIVPARPSIPSFLFVGAQDPSTTIEDQLAVLAEADPAWVRAEMEMAWGSEPLPRLARETVEQGHAGVHRISEALYDYWQAVIEPYWPRMRAVLDADLTHRAGRLMNGGLRALLTDLHPELAVEGQTLRINKPRWSGQHDLAGRGLSLVPSVFAWPRLVADFTPPNHPTITYGARGVGALWQPDAEPGSSDALGALLGRTRAIILTCLDLPLSTTRLAKQIGCSAPAVSQHLAILRQCGLVTSRRAGRSVLYQRTALATSLLTASHRGDASRLAAVYPLT